MSADGQTERWLVTGANGQLGRSLLDVSASHGIEALGLCRQQLDITDAQSVDAAIDEFAPDVVLNAAAFTQVDLCEDQADEATAKDEG